MLSSPHPRLPAMADSVPARATGMAPIVIYDKDPHSLCPGTRKGDLEAYAKVSLKKYKPMAAWNEDRNVSSGLL